METTIRCAFERAHVGLDDAERPHSSYRGQADSQGRCAVSFLHQHIAFLCVMHVLNLSSGNVGWDRIYLGVLRPWSSIPVMHRWAPSFYFLSDPWKERQESDRKVHKCRAGDDREHGCRARRNHIYLPLHRRHARLPGGHGERTCRARCRPRTAAWPARPR